MGRSADRRTLLDRVALYRDPASLDEVAAYQRAVRERQRAMESRGVNARDLDGWEELIVRHARHVMAARERAAALVIAEATLAFERIGSAGTMSARYEPTAPRDEASYRAELVKHRPRDVRRRSASIGPHRDDLVVELGGMPARSTASQGQHRALVLALKAAELKVIGDARGVEPVLLLDDVSSELDVARTAAFFQYLASQRGQIFLTTTRPELIALHDTPLDERVDFRIVAGRLLR
jgi:DNA replication and repair protein RecF